MYDERLCMTEFDARRLLELADEPCRSDRRDAGSVALLLRHVDDAEIMPPTAIGPNVVTMGSEVRVKDLDADEMIIFASSSRIGERRRREDPVLAPLGMGVLGHRVGDLVTWRTPGGVRRLRVDHILYQPEREGRDVA